MKDKNALRVLTVKQPFASLLCWGVKDVENRSQKTNIRGRVLIHAGAQWYGDFYRGKSAVAKVFFPSNILTKEQRESMTFEQRSKLLKADTYLPLSAIIGEVEIVDCVQNHPSVWAIPGYWHWVVENAVLFPEPIPCKGALSFWRPQGALIDQIFEQQIKLTSTLVTA